MSKYLKHRFGEKQKQYGIGKSTDPLVQLHARFQRQEMASKPVYHENVAAENRQFEIFSLVWRLAMRRLDHVFTNLLQTHGMTRTRDGVITRMVTPVHTTTADSAIPAMTTQAMNELLERVEQNDKAALVELKNLVKSDPGRWLSDVDLVSIAKNEILHCFANSDPVSRALLHEKMQEKLDTLSLAPSSPLERLIIEHIQVCVIAAQYNRLMLIDGRRSMRERSSFESRAEKAELQLKASLQTFLDLKVLTTSNWTMLPKELPVVESAVYRKQNVSSAPVVGEKEWELDADYCSMVI